MIYIFLFLWIFSDTENRVSGWKHLTGGLNVMRITQLPSPLGENLCSHCWLCIPDSLTEAAVDIQSLQITTCLTDSVIGEAKNEDLHIWSLINTSCCHGSLRSGIYQVALDSLAAWALWTLAVRNLTQCFDIFPPNYDQLLPDIAEAYSNIALGSLLPDRDVWLGFKTLVLQPAIVSVCRWGLPSRTDR